MIYSNLSIFVPGIERSVRNLAWKSFKLASNYCLEVQLTYQRTLLVGCGLDVRPTGDHRGFSFDVGLLGLSLIVSFYDVRHADEDIPF